MNNLKQLRNIYNLKQEEIAKITGVTQQQVSRWELGKRDLEIKHAKKIAKALNCNWKDLYED